MSPAPGLYEPFAPTDTFFVGQHNLFERNGVVLNDLSLKDTYVIDDLSGFSTPEGSPANEVLASTHGEAFVQTNWGGRTMILSGYVRAGTYTQAMILGERLQRSIATRREMPLRISTAAGSVLTQLPYEIMCQPADFTIDPKAQPSDITKVFTRKFSLALRASFPFFEAKNVLKTQYNWTGQPYFIKNNAYQLSSTNIGTTANGPGTIPNEAFAYRGLPGYRVQTNPSVAEFNTAGPTSTSPDDWMAVSPGDQVFGSVEAICLQASADLTVITQLVWRNAAGVNIGVTGSTSVPLTSVGGGTLTVSGTAPANAAYVSRTTLVRRYQTGPTDVWFTRAWTGFGTGFPVGGYKDGNSAGWEWVGTKNQSFSRPDGSMTYTLTPTVVSIPARPYDRVYDLTYSELMDQNGNIVSSGPNVLDVLNEGSWDPGLMITMEGKMSKITLVNETTRQAMFFRDVAAGSSIKVNPRTGEIYDSSGFDRPQLLDSRSDHIVLAGKRDGRTGLNRLVLYVEEFDSSAKMSISYRRTQF